MVVVTVALSFAVFGSTLPRLSTFTDAVSEPDAEGAVTSMVMRFGPAATCSAEQVTTRLDSEQLHPAPEAFTKPMDDGNVLVTTTPSAESLARLSATT